MSAGASCVSVRRRQELVAPAVVAVAAGHPAPTRRPAAPRTGPTSRPNHSRAIRGNSSRDNPNHDSRAIRHASLQVRGAIPRQWPPPCQPCPAEAGAGANATAASASAATNNVRSFFILDVLQKPGPLEPATRSSIGRIGPPILGDSTASIALPICWRGQVGHSGYTTIRGDMTPVPTAASVRPPPTHQ
jgi:hypothetical protein